MNENFKVELKLSVQQVNQVLSALSNLPYAQVADLIGEIKSTAEEQIREANEQ